jgi:hypothetical protein
MTLALQADQTYTHRLTKTPNHPRWRTFWERGQPYELGELRDYLGDRLPLRIPRESAVGEGRNVTLFDNLRRWAYRARFSYKDLDSFEQACRGYATALNSYVSPLALREVHQVAKSVAKWTWQHFTPEDFARIQASRGRKSGAMRQAEAMNLTAKILEFSR